MSTAGHDSCRADVRRPRPSPRLKALGQDPRLLLLRPDPTLGTPGDQLDPPISASLMTVIKTCISHCDTPALSQNASSFLRSPASSQVGNSQRLPTICQVCKTVSHGWPATTSCKLWFTSKIAKLALLLDIVGKET